MDSITNCDSFFITKCDTVYYKLRQVLQSAMIITNCDSTGSRFCDVICAQRYLTYLPLKVDWLFVAFNFLFKPPKECQFHVIGKK